MRTLWLMLHLMAVVVWVGGMYFAHVCLRPEAARLEPPARLALLSGVLGRVFVQVTWALVVLWGSGIIMMTSVGMKGAPASWHLMMGIAVVMTLLFVVIRQGLHPRLVAAVAAANWPAGGAVMALIRKLVLVNLVLGFVTILVALSGWLVF